MFENLLIAIDKIICINGHYIILSFYPFTEENRLTEFYTTLMGVKFFLLGINILADAIIISAYLKCWDSSDKDKKIKNYKILEQMRL